MWAQWAVGLAALISVAAAVFQFVVRPLLRGAVTLESVAPVIVQIAKDFPNRNGSSLKSRLDKQDKKLIDLDRKVERILRGQRAPGGAPATRGDT